MLVLQELTLLLTGYVAGSSANVFVANHDTERVRQWFRNVFPPL